MKYFTGQDLDRLNEAIDFFLYAEMAIGQLEAEKELAARTLQTNSQMQEEDCFTSMLCQARQDSIDAAEILIARCQHYFEYTNVFSALLQDKLDRACLTTMDPEQKLKLAKELAIKSPCRRLQELVTASCNEAA